MPVKVLMPPAVRGGSFIVGENGCLRVVDSPRKCWGRRTGCCCRACGDEDARKEAGRRRAAVAVLVCVCDRPMIFDETCAHCGHRTIQAA
jgi:hypothetical protein